MNWILIAGLVRNPEIALVQAAQVRRLQEAGLVQGVVFSTWHDEFGRYEKVRRAFQDLGAVLVESPQPLLRFPGHVLHQSLALQIGLEYVPDGVKVLRIRPDAAPLNTMIDDVLAHDWLAEDYGFGYPTAYSRRIWCYGGLLDWPFYINDMLFYGHKRDIERLCRIDLTIEWRYSEAAPEQFYHLGPIASVNPVLDAYARFQRGQHGPVQNEKRSDVLWGCAFWYDTLLATAKEMLANYCVGFANPQTVFSDVEMAQFSAVSLRSIFKDNTATTFIERHRGAGANMFHALHWAKAVLEGRFQPDGDSERLDDARRRSLADAMANARHYGDLMRNAFGMPLPPTDAAHPGVIRRPEKPINIQSQIANDYTHQLEEEVNALRRLCDKPAKVG